MKPHSARFRFHGCLNDFLPPEQRQQTLVCRFRDHPGIKDPIEALGIPHSEIGQIVVHDQIVNLAYHLQPGDEAEIFPEIPIRPDTAPCFIVDVNLGKLARWLRLLGFDTTWRNDLQDRKIVDISTQEQRIILTRDRHLLFHREIHRGYWIRAADPDLQVPEILNRLDLWRDIAPFRRCTVCNGLIQVVAKAEIVDKLEPLTRKYYDNFYQCDGCGQIYWKGSHYDKLLKKLKAFEDHG
ncbi:Mut7-C RNAse domain-containing protein [Thiolapillus sp.]